jgi:hypothetical protein
MAKPDWQDTAILYSIAQSDPPGILGSDFVVRRLRVQFLLEHARKKAELQPNSAFCLSAQRGDESIDRTGCQGENSDGRKKVCTAMITASSNWRIQINTVIE